MSPVRRLTLGFVACAAVFAGLLAPSALTAVGGGQAASPATIFIDASVTDASAPAVTTLRPEDLRVSVDGKPRKVVSLRFVCRGPGADVAAALVGRSKSAAGAVERTRVLLLVADENAIVRGQQKPVTAAVARVLDGLGSADVAAVATLPRPQAGLVLNSDAVLWQAAVAQITGRAVSDTLASDRRQPPTQSLRVRAQEGPIRTSRHVSKSSGRQHATGVVPRRTPQMAPATRGRARRFARCAKSSTVSRHCRASSPFSSSGKRNR